MDPERAAIVACARGMVAATVGTSPGGCVYLACAVALAARPYGRRLLPQAGSCTWRRTLDGDPEMRAFGYEWTSIYSPALAAAGVLPEMHAWCVDPERRELVDVAAGEFPAMCRRTLGLSWTAPLPPDALWCSWDALPDGASYRATQQATEFAVDLMMEGGIAERLRAGRRAVRGDAAIP